jgi:hypothetical protein
MESESKNIIQMLNNEKQIIYLSKERDCWSLEELKEIDITEHNVSEILSQIQDKNFDNSMDEVILILIIFMIIKDF